MGSRHRDASDNFITQVVTTDFPVGCGLIEIELSDNRITFLGPNAFANCGGTLQALRLKGQVGGALTSVDAAAFRGLGWLDRLKLEVVVAFALISLNSTISRAGLSASPHPVGTPCGPCGVSSMCCPS